MSLGKHAGLYINAEGIVRPERTIINNLQRLFSAFYKAKSELYLSHHQLTGVLNRVIVTVTNDLATDQRVQKVCAFLHKKGARVTLVGRKLPDSLPLSLPYRTKRMRLLFNKGPLFYAEYNLRLFLYLLFKWPNMLVANDLDTLLANYWVSSLTGADLVYDSHEYFTEVPELVQRPGVRRVWKEIEEFIFPHLLHVYTVNESIATLYKRKYGVDVKVVRNIPLYRELEAPKSRAQLTLPPDRKIIILQGSWINVDRGGEEAVQMMQYLNDALLLVCGGGDAIPTLKQLVAQLGLEDKVMFKPKMPFNELRHYTAAADLGLSLDKDTNLNYRYSLPNKIFDYIHAGTPVLASDLVEIKRIVTENGVGVITPGHQPQDLANLVRATFEDQGAYQKMKANCLQARQTLCWQNEESVLKSIYSDLLID